MHDIRGDIKHEQTAIKTYPIVMVAPKEPKKYGISNGNLYSYLPTSTTIQAPLNIQLPVKLNLDRSSMCFKGDAESTEGTVECSGDTTLWNLKMMKELYTNVIPLFYKELKGTVENIFQFIPTSEKIKDKEKGFFSYGKINEHFGEHILEAFKGIKYFTNVEGKPRTCEEVVMYDKFISDNFNEDYHLFFNEVNNTFIQSNERLIPYHSFTKEELKCLKQFEFSPKEPLNNEEDKVKVFNRLLESDDPWEDKKDDGKNYLTCEENNPIYPIIISKYRDILFKAYMESEKNGLSSFLPSDPSGLSIFYHIHSYVRGSGDFLLKDEPAENFFVCTPYDSDNVWFYDARTEIEKGKAPFYSSDTYICFSPEEKLPFGLKITKVKNAMDVFQTVATL